jgi:hypothetical protein
MNRLVSFIIRVLKEDPLSPGILDVIVVVTVICLPPMYNPIEFSPNDQIQPKLFVSINSYQAKSDLARIFYY